MPIADYLNRCGIPSELKVGEGIKPTFINIRLKQNGQSEQHMWVFYKNEANKLQITHINYQGFTHQASSNGASAVKITDIYLADPIALQKLESELRRWI